MPVTYIMGTYCEAILGSLLGLVATGVTKGIVGSLCSGFLGRSFLALRMRAAEG